MSGEVRKRHGGATVQRTCLGCRSVVSRTGLLRVTLIGGRRPGADINNSAGGRGAYICMKKECLRAACKKKGAISRALRKKLSNIEVEELFDEITGILDARLDSGVMGNN